MNLILGSRGRLGHALVSSLRHDDVVPLDRGLYADWWREGAEDGIARFLEGVSDAPGVVYVASGLTDPRADREDHDRVNFRLPRNVVAGAVRAGWHAVTFGTVMETLAREDRANPYVTSKSRLGDFVSDLASDSKQTAIHVRLHTLYGGGVPADFMFLGLVLDSIVRNADFRMSPGCQLREYHHVDDDASALSRFVGARITGAVDLSHGDPIELRVLASRIFEELGCPELLRVGALPAPASDNYSRVFEPHPLLRGFPFRSTVASVIEYLRGCKAILEATS